MSLSDFSISSPRKAKPGDKSSLTYDEDFENFLNDEVNIDKKKMFIRY